MKNISNKKKGIIKFRIKKDEAEINKIYKDVINQEKEFKLRRNKFLKTYDESGVEIIEVKIGYEDFITLDAISYEYENILSKLRAEYSKALIIDGYKYSEGIEGDTFIVQDYILINEKGEEKKIKIKNQAPKIIFK